MCGCMLPSPGTEDSEDVGLGEVLEELVRFALSHQPAALL